jgi:hypothetical protein
MTRAEVTHWLWALMAILDSERHATAEGGDLCVTLSPDVALQMASALHAAVELLCPEIREAEEEAVR